MISMLLALLLQAATIPTTPDTITADIARMEPGDELVLAPGNYLGPVTLPNRLAGSAERLTTIRAAEPLKARIAGVRGVGDGLQIGTEAVYPEGCHWTIVRDLELAFSKRDGIRVYGSNVLIQDCWIHHNGIVNNPPDKIPTGQGASAFGDNHNVVFRTCRIEKNGGNGFSHGIYIYGWHHRIERCVIRDNAGYGVHGYALNTGLEVLGNQIYRNGGAGIYIKSRNGETAPNIVRGNIAVQNGTYGLVLIDGETVPEIEDNIFTENKLGPFAVGGTCPVRSVASMPASGE